MIIKVNSKMCNGTGLCEQICPDVFELRNGVSTIKVGEVPPDAENSCKEAVYSCPTEAISIIED